MIPKVIFGEGTNFIESNINVWSNILLNVIVKVNGGSGCNYSWSLKCCLRQQYGSEDDKEGILKQKEGGRVRYK